MPASSRGRRSSAAVRAPCSFLGDDGLSTSRVRGAGAGLAAPSLPALPPDERVHYESRLKKFRNFFLRSKK